jgi:hypothetical protein
VEFTGLALATVIDEQFTPTKHLPYVTDRVKLHAEFNNFSSVKLFCFQDGVSAIVTLIGFVFTEKFAARVN